MREIKWEEGAICFSRGAQIRLKDGSFSALERLTGGRTWRAELKSPTELIGFDDFQLNEIRICDYIEASELDTEQKYNDAVSVFGLFGFIHGEGATSQYSEVEGYGSLTVCHDGIFATEVTPKWCARKLTYPQLMAIGKLKRAMIEKSAPKIAPDLTPDVEFKDGNKYHRTIYGLCGTPVKVDVYRVSDAYPTGSASIDHAVKKMLCAGLRGHKDKLTDIDNAIESLQAARLLLIQKGDL